LNEIIDELGEMRTKKQMWFWRTSALLGLPGRHLPLEQQLQPGYEAQRQEGFLAWEGHESGGYRQ